MRDGLERAVQKLTEISALPANASKVEIRNAISEHDNELKRAKEQPLQQEQKTGGSKPRNRPHTRITATKKPPAFRLMALVRVARVELTAS